MQKDIQQTWFFNQPAQEVWDYLTQPELIEQWLMKNDFKPIVGHKFQFISDPEHGCNDGGITYCEVLEVIPNKQLSYSWKGGKEDGPATLDSVVIWTLTEKNNGTELRLLHNGFTVLEDYESHQNGWTKLVHGFVELLNTIQK